MAINAQCTQRYTRYTLRLLLSSDTSTYGWYLIIHLWVCACVCTAKRIACVPRPTENGWSWRTLCIINQCTVSTAVTVCLCHSIFAASRWFIVVNLSSVLFSSSVRSHSIALRFLFISSSFFLSPCDIRLICNAVIRCEVLFISILFILFASHRLFYEILLRLVHFTFARLTLLSPVGARCHIEFNFEIAANTEFSVGWVTSGMGNRMKEE